ncbi:UvrD-helicase domain-containing protein [Candidatus Saccharibacteria bacterium]|nr:UvrD-helicase domain-containing protein [Candidatus Saccharibacteria bacterium]MBI3338249.1 UvrD-helicase domain-containing protein [Candidatus Saccharibacteria bacterium]
MLEDLNTEQKRAVETTEGPLLILAGAGSGKTKTLTHRIAHIIATKKATPFNILAVTFTNKAAKEMRARVAKLLGEDPNNRSFMPFMGTFHSICVRLLRQDGEYVGVPRNFVIFDEADRINAVKRAIKQLMLDEKSFPARTIANLIGTAKNELVTPAEYTGIGSGPLHRAAAQVYPLYEKILKDNLALDFDDLIGRTVQLLQNHKEIRDKWRGQFSYIMIDEYQDTNAAQYQLIRLLTNTDKNIAVVGDDWQSVYSFRGADFRNILNFEKDYPKTTIIKLEQNYRSTKAILDAAHAVISKNKQRSDKNLWTDAGNGQPVQLLQAANERAEGETIIRHIKNAIDVRFRRFEDFAVLYRTNAQSRAIEESFVRYGIPYRIVGGQRFYDRKEIKDIMAYLRLIYQPEDRVSFERIVNVPTRGIGTKSMQNFFDWQVAKSLTLAGALQDVNSCSSLTPRAQKGLFEFGDILVKMRELVEETTLPIFMDSLLRRIDYFNFLDDKTLQGESRQENVRELISVAREYQDLGIDGFLEEVSLVSDLGSQQLDSNAVTLMTLHSAKGLEFPVVFMTGLEETIFPHSRALYDQGEMEEERRLCYVGMTRAKEELYLTYATSRMLYGSTQYNPPSRFLSEIDSEASLLDLRKTPPSPDRILSATNGFSSLDVAMATSPSDKTVFARDNSLWERTILRKSSLSLASDFSTSPPAIGAHLIAEAESEVKYVLDLNEGDSVKHKIFGSGTILEIDGDNANVYFKGKGTKKLNIAFASLEKI